VSFGLFASLRGYDRKWLTGDLIAGLTVWAVLVPEALAYATIAGVSPVIGLYAAPGALLLYAAFGSSKHLVTGPMAATAALSAAAVADLATEPDDFLAFTVILALVVGFMAVLAGLFRLGFVANFISEPVLKGFIIGLALTIIVGQLPKLFGIEKVDGDFFDQLWGWITGLGETDGLTLAIGLTSLAIVFGFRRFLPRIPGSLVARFRDRRGRSIRPRREGRCDRR
jgi:MFS superfamily sulfate permease-like transporter